MNHIERQKLLNRLNTETQFLNYILDKKIIIMEAELKSREEIRELNALLAAEEEEK
jgi:hypothetical protein